VRASAGGELAAVLVGQGHAAVVVVVVVLLHAERRAVLVTAVGLQQQASPGVRADAERPGGRTRDAVLIYHVDRLTRRPIELEQFLDVLTAAKVGKVGFVAGGDLDVGNGDGLMVLRMLLAVAANESSTKSRRVKRKMLQNAEAGLPHGGYQRPFGYDHDKVTVRPDEAQVVRTVAERFLAGESLRSLAVWLDEQGVATVSGKPWRTPTLRSMLASGRRGRA
jgi:site-specific DNA recombinase